jgi:hypothetical protein
MGEDSAARCPRCVAIAGRLEAVLQELRRESRDSARHRTLLRSVGTLLLKLEEHRCAMPIERVA